MPQYRKRNHHEPIVSREDYIAVQKFDPDAEIMSLSLTVPSWISSINRVKTSTKVDEVTASAQNKIADELNKLKTAIDSLLCLFEEENNG